MASQPLHKGFFHILSVMVDRYIKVVVVVGTPKSKLKFISQTEIPKNPAITGNPASAVVTPLFA